MERVAMADKICIVTGASSGIGKWAALGLAKLGATIVMVSKSRERGESARDEILEKTRNKAPVDLMFADLSSQRSIRQLAENFKKRYPRLDVLVNNAGGVFSPRRQTEDGIEYTFALNHLAYFLLTELVLDVLKASAPSRIVNVASDAHTAGHIDFDLEGRRRYWAYRAYSQSKLANVLFTYELARGLEGTGVTVNAVHPGVVRTNFGSTASVPFRILVKIAGPFMRSPEKGAETVVYLATSNDVNGVTGRYFFDKKERRSSKESYDLEVAKRLWETSEKLTRLR